ncbi:MAG: SOS response-associated peptidase [bacterium]|nr:SOS response-associated peptidase [bacterium]
MCGRFVVASKPDELQTTFPDFVFPDEMPLRYNITPGQDIPVLTNSGANTVEHFKWGLIPSWAKDPKIGNRLINARSETLAEKPSFRNAFKKRRCIIPVTGFYEWRPNPNSKTKTPMFIRLQSERPFGFAGLWETWRPETGDVLHTCTIITTEPNALMQTIHNRMPVILKPDAYEQWLSPEDQPGEELSSLLTPYPDSEMVAYPVSTRVNNPGNDSPQCVEPVEDAPPSDQATLF